MNNEDSFELHAQRKKHPAPQKKQWKKGHAKDRAGDGDSPIDGFFAPKIIDRGTNQHDAKRDGAGTQISSDGVSNHRNIDVESQGIHQKCGYDGDDGRIDEELPWSPLHTRQHPDCHCPEGNLDTECKSEQDPDGGWREKGLDDRDGHVPIIGNAA